MSAEGTRTAELQVIQMFETLGESYLSLLSIAASIASLKTLAPAAITQASFQAAL